MRAVLSIAMATLTLTLGLASRPMQGQIQAGGSLAMRTIHMVDAQTGWAVLIDGGLLLRTTDGGTLWTDVTPFSAPGEPIRVGQITVLSCLIAWVSRIGSSGSTTTEIFRTIDGGRSWGRAVIPAPEVKSMSFINPREGWLIAFLDAGMGNENVDIYRSTNGGETWIRVASARDSSASSGLPYGDKSSITFVNPTTGWITGLGPKPDSLYLYVTRDAGRTWRQQNLRIPPPPQRQPSQPLPTDVTAHWVARARPPKFFTARDGIMRVDYIHYLFNDSTEDKQVTVAAFVYYVTHDAGATWTYMTPTHIKQILDRRPSSFVDMSHGWVKEENALYVTSDGGRRWTTIRPGPLTADVTQLDFISPKVGWAVRNTAPYGGGPPTFPFLLKTLDGGRTWTTVTYTIAR